MAHWSREVPEMQDELRSKRRVTDRLISIGVPLTLVYIAGLTLLVPPLRGMDGVVDRLVLALRCDAVAAVMLVAGVLAIGMARHGGDAMDPLSGGGSRRLQVHGRYLQNTLEQLVVFVVTTAALATWLDGSTAHVLPILTSAFVIARLVFWAGYLRDPLLRSLGMSMTFTTNLPALLYVLYCTACAALG